MLDDAVGFVAEDSIDAGLGLLYEALEAAASLSTLSERGRTVPEIEDPGTRELFVQRKTLRDLGRPHTITREPGGTAVGDGIRRILLDSETIHLTPAAELLLFYASRSQNLTEKVRPAKSRGEMILCHRFVDASLAYQGFRARPSF